MLRRFIGTVLTKKAVYHIVPLLIVLALPVVASAQVPGVAQMHLLGLAGDVFEAGMEIAIKPIAMLILTFSGWILGVVGVFFNWVVLKTVFQFSLYFGTSDGMLIAWGVLRDISNIALLFGFIFMGVLLILNVDGGGHGHGGGISARKAIPRLIIFAVLLNFSLFTTQFVIDVANAFASQFAVLAGSSCDPGSSTMTLGECANEGISKQVMQMAGMSTIWTTDLNNFHSDTVVLLGLSVFVLITATVLLAAGIMLVIRAVVLSFLMVTSPIGFAGMVIPGLGKVAKDWWHSLISQSFYAPVMLLLVFVSLKVAESLNPDGKSVVHALSGDGSGIASNLQVVVIFAVVIGFMIASLIAASKIGAIGAGFATNVASTAVFGGMARISNAAVGGAARGLRYGVQRTPLKDTGIGQVAVNRVFRPLEKTNLDMRRAGVGAILGAAGATSGAKAAEHATYGEMAHEVADIRAGKKRAELKEQFDAEVKNGDLERAAHDGTLNDGSAASKELIRHLNSLSVKELEQLHGIQEGVDQMVQNLTPEQFSKLMDSKDLKDDAKGKLGAARLKGVKDLVDAGDKDKLRKWSTKDLERLSKSSTYSGLLADNKFAALINDDQYDALMKSNELSPVQRAALETARTEGRFGDPAAAAATLATLSTENVGKLKGSVVARPDVFTNMTGKQLAAIDPSKLSPTELAAVKRHIEAERLTGSPVGYEFMQMYNFNPKVKERWSGEIV